MHYCTPFARERVRELRFAAHKGLAGWMGLRGVESRQGVDRQGMNLVHLVGKAFRNQSSDMCVYLQKVLEPGQCNTLPLSDRGVRPSSGGCNTAN